MRAIWQKTVLAESADTIVVEGIRFEWLPAYAPDLNPVEALWSHTKYSDLANFLPDDEHDLRRSVSQSIEAQRRHKHLLRSSFTLPS